MRLKLALFIFISASLIYGQWSNIGFLGQTVNKVAANQHNGEIYAIVGDQLFRTSDHGLHWDSLTSGLEFLQVLTVEIDIDQKIYVGTNSGIFVSEDHGVSFQNMSSNMPNDFGLYPAVTSICIINERLFVGTGAGVFTTNKTDRDWTSFNNNLPLDQSKKNMIYFNNRLFMAMNSGIYTTQVSSNYWTKVYSGKVSDITSDGYIIYAANQAMAPATINEDCVAAIKSLDFGQTWEMASPGVGDCSGLSIFAFENSVWLGTFYGSGMYTTNAGQSWESLDLGAWFSVINFTRRGSSLLAATDHSHIEGSGGIYIRSNIFSNIKEVLPSPAFFQEPGSYESPLVVKIIVPTNADVYYTENGSIPNVYSKKYTDPIVVDKSKFITAIAIDSYGQQSKANTGFFKIGNSEFTPNKPILKATKAHLHTDHFNKALHFATDDHLVQATITNINGVIVKKITADKKKRNHSLHIDDLESGVYILKIRTPKSLNHISFVKK